MAEEHIRNREVNRLYYYQTHMEHSLSRNAILHRIRSGMEHTFYQRLFSQATNGVTMYRPQLDRLDKPGHLDNTYLCPREKHAPMCRDAAIHFCNKTAPFYTVSSFGGGHMHALNICLLRWLFHRWFVPYRSEIEFGQFIARFICTKACLPEKLEDRVECMVKFHRRVCAEVDEQLVLMDDWHQTLMDPLWDKSTPPEDVDLWTIRPSFRALVVVALYEDYPIYEGHIGQTPLLVIRTGDEEGLSSPICLDIIDESAKVQKIVGKDGKTLEAVYTSLEKTYEFLSALDQREITAFGHQPDPKRKGYGHYSLSSIHRNFGEGKRHYLRRLGWEGEFSVDAPSSTWVDVDKFPASLSAAYYVHDNVCQRDDNNRIHVMREISMKRFLVRHYEGTWEDCGMSPRLGQLNVIVKAHLLKEIAR